VIEARPSDPRQEFLPGKEFRLLDRYELQTELVETLRDTSKHNHLVHKVAACHRSFRHWRCENDHDWAEAENSCSVRVCPHCAYRRTLVLAGRIERYTVGKPGLRYAVLAERNCTDLADGVKSLWAAWTSLRRGVRWKKYVRGCIVALEVTYNADEGTWHPHLNVLMEGEFFPFEELNQAWIDATEHRGRTSYIRAADEGTVRELIKYVTKVADLLDDAEVLDEFLSAIDRKRLVRTYGTFYGLNVADEELPQQDGDCPDCGPHKHVSVVKLGYVSPQQVRIDFNGVLRVTRTPSQVSDDLREAMQFPPSLPAPKLLRPPCALLRHWDRLHDQVLRATRGRKGEVNYGNSTSDTNHQQPSA